MKNVPCLQIVLSKSSGTQLHDWSPRRRCTPGHAHSIRVQSRSQMLKMPKPHKGQKQLESTVLNTSSARCIHDAVQMHLQFWLEQRAIVCYTVFK